MKRIAALLTALCMLWVLPGTAAAQNSLTLECGLEDNGASLALEGLEETVCALQLDLVLQGVCPDVTFVSETPDAYVPKCRAEVRNGRTYVTIYMVAPEGVLTSSERLDLGWLEAGDDFSLPERGELILLDRDLQPCQGSGTVSVYSYQSSWPPDEPYLPVGPGSRPSPGGSAPGGQELPDEPADNRPVTPPDDPAPFPFLDVPADYWCRSEVDYIYRSGLMTGTSASTFSPDTAITRGMIVTILYRMEGLPAASISKNSYVAPDAYYAGAVAWGAANGIVNGYEDGSFRPNDPITREQMAAFLFRYARYQGRDVSARADLSGYIDANQISGYAVESLRWANAMGLITGTSVDTITPAGNATRGQAAVILTRFILNSGQI